MYQSFISLAAGPAAILSLLRDSRYWHLGLERIEHHLSKENAIFHCS